MHIEHVCKFFVIFFSATIDDTNLIFGHKLHIGTLYRGKRFWTHQIPTSCLPTMLIFIHIEHMYSFFVAFFSANIDGRNLIFRHKLHIGTPYYGKRRGYHKWALAHSSSCLVHFIEYYMPDNMSSARTLVKHFLSVKIMYMLHIELYILCHWLLFI